MRQAMAAFAVKGRSKRAADASACWDGDPLARDCPLAIILRGVALLAALGGLFGFAMRLAPKAPALVTGRASLRAPVVDSPVLERDARPILAKAVVIEPARRGQNPRVRRTFLKLLQMDLETKRSVLRFGPMRVKRSIVATILRAARATNSDPVLLMAIADKESSFSTSAAARTSSALGLFQFVDNTWLKAVRDFGARFGLADQAAMIVGPRDRPFVADAAARAQILALRRDPYLSTVMAAEMLKRDSRKIALRIGRRLTSGETYLAHFLGTNDAELFMEKVVGEPQARAAALLPQPARANYSLFYARGGKRPRQLTVAAVHHEFEKMIGLRLNRYKSIGAAAELSAYANIGSQ